MTPPPLPFDVHARIIQFVYITSQSHEVDYKTLYACALVCKDWVPIAQRLLFRRIPYPSNDWLLRNFPLLDAIPRVLHAVTTNPLLGTYIFSISVALENDEIFVPANPERIDYYALLRRCSHIAQVRLYLAGLRGQRTYTAALSQLRTLALRPTVLIAAPDTGDTGLFAALAMWPSVRDLVVEGWGTRVTYPLPAQLRSVAHEDVLFFCPPEPATAAQYTAEELDAGSLNFPDSISGGIGWGSLRTLTCRSLPSTGGLQQFTRLESLVLLNLPSDPVTLPRTLRHFGFHSTHDKEMQGPNDVEAAWYAEEAELNGEGESDEEAEAIKAQCLGYLVSALADESALPELRQVSVTRSSSQVVLQALEALCKLRGVEIVSYADPESYPRARYVDWIS
ncbi:hypothetical protein FA95DRAFT_1612645 [Auriscalpium vulgare]|uniref:Uncharacterized protein n=1 Tax=Auriscalpium vulgare TaxID=40419 RepID=A0ACB8R6X1_9AGAM|nr:hypothetical protein FA95DRAFT_1612645 [Auriscalpium vulgare]